MAQKGILKANRFQISKKEELRLSLQEEQEDAEELDHFFESEREDGHIYPFFDEEEPALRRYDPYEYDDLDYEAGLRHPYYADAY